ncbi:MAG: hypothetical protein DI628_06270 [Blastochloris viridis]|uniref:Lipoprotein n=1 Tax=Blastochloris viridis TaxID=1079 RepID=A0A6N4QYL7_BLAVI|nr:MAG: hypothetical protein DI628_06270 [Blastochloris viridis]
MMKRIVMLGIAGLVTACGSSAAKAQREAELAKCPPEAVQVVRDNQMFLDQGIELSKTPARALSGRKGIYRTATVKRDGVTMDAVFLVTNMKSCGWVTSGWDSLTPVLVQDGVIVGVGAQTLRDMTGQGWVIKESKWPWQSYDFGYLPRR